jgi:hypothetical protein
VYPLHIRLLHFCVGRVVPIASEVLHRWEDQSGDTRASFLRISRHSSYHHFLRRFRPSHDSRTISIPSRCLFIHSSRFFPRTIRGSTNRGRFGWCRRSRVHLIERELLVSKISLSAYIVLYLLFQKLLKWGTTTSQY